MVRTRNMNSSITRAQAMANPFPYAPFMALHLGMADDEREAGFYAGYIMSTFMVGRIISSYPLGILSDKLGRRPIVELGLWSCIVFQFGFGLSPSFYFALIMRFLMGVFNAILAVAKAWLPDAHGRSSICSYYNGTELAQSFSSRRISWSARKASAGSCK